jgi:hypothetical protein
MDVHPASFARWSASNYPEALVGVIQSNAWSYVPGNAFAPGYENLVGLQAQATTPLITAYPFAMFVHATMPDAPTTSMYVSLQSDVNSDPITGNFVDFQIGAGGNYIGAECYIRLGAVYLSEYPSHNVSGTHKYVFWIDGSAWALVADGSIVSQGSATVPLFTDLDGFTFNTQGANSSVIDRVLHAVGLYQGITLSEAIALTA